MGVWGAQAPKICDLVGNFGFSLVNGQPFNVSKLLQEIILKFILSLSKGCTCLIFKGDPHFPFLPQWLL